MNVKDIAKTEVKERKIEGRPSTTAQRMKRWDRARSKTKRNKNELGVKSEEPSLWAFEPLYELAYALDRTATKCS